MSSKYRKHTGHNARVLRASNHDQTQISRLEQRVRDRGSSVVDINTKIYYKSQHSDCQELVFLNVGRCVQPFNRLPDDANGGKAESRAVQESRKRFHAAVSIGKARVSRPLGHHAGKQGEDDCGIVKEHVDGITGQPKRVCPDPIQRLHYTTTQTDTALSNEEIYNHAPRRR